MLSTKFSITSHNCDLNGFLLMPEGNGPHPVVLLLHGFPGNQKNYDIAHALRLSGYNAIIFSYRGSWGSEGSYKFQHVLEDTQAVIGQIRNPEIARKYRFDPERIYVIGHSLGGWNALMSTAHNPAVRATAALAAFNLGYFAERLQTEPKFRDQLIRDLNILGLEPLSGTSAEDLADEIAAHHKTWDPREHFASLSDRPVLLLGATDDIEAPKAFHHDAIVSAFEASGHNRLKNLIFESDHGFTDQRGKLIAELLAWLDEFCNI